MAADRLTLTLEPLAAAAGLTDEASVDTVALLSRSRSRSHRASRRRVDRARRFGTKIGGLDRLPQSNLQRLPGIVAARARALASRIASPRVSIAMPSYMQGLYVARAIRSVIAQDIQDWELLVHDAVSTDETRAVLEEAAALDPRVKLVVEPDGGQSDAINRAFRRASGDVLCWLNADDEFERDALRRALDALDRSGCDLVYGRLLRQRGGRLHPPLQRPALRPRSAEDDRLHPPAGHLLAALAVGAGRRAGHEAQLRLRLGVARPGLWVTDFDLVDADLARYRLTGDNKSLTSDPRRERELAKVARRNCGFRQPTFLYWNARRLGRRWRGADRYADSLWARHQARICT